MGGWLKRLTRNVVLVAGAANAALLLTAFPGNGTAVAAEPRTKAVVIMYHRFGEGDFPTTNVTMEQFRAHVAELKSGGYHVLSLPKIVAALRDGEPLPEKAVGLSVDDAYVSVIDKAWPILKEAGFPLTVFVATDPIDQGTPRYMSWDQIRQLAADGVSIGSQTKTHPHMADISLAARLADLTASNQRFEAELGRAPDLFAYPYGETDLATFDVVKKAGFVAGFGQHSGAIGSDDNIYYLARFAMNETFGSVDRFRLAANALPMAVRDFTPADPKIGSKNPPSIGFTVDWPETNRDRLTCYTSNLGKVANERLGPRIEIRLPEAFPKGRSRLNCTIPAGDGRWHWFGRQLYVGSGS